MESSREVTEKSMYPLKFIYTVKVTLRCEVGRSYQLVYNLVYVIGAMRGLEHKYFFESCCQLEHNWILLILGLVRICGFGGIVWK